MEGYIRMRDYKWYTKLKNLIKNRLKGMSWWWSYGRWIYNYLCNHCLSPLTLWVRIHSVEVYLIQHYLIKFISDLRQVGGFLRVLCFPSPTGWWFSPGTPLPFTNKTDRHYVTEILLKVVLNTITLTLRVTPFKFGSL